MWSTPAPNASSMISWIAGVSPIGISSLGTALVAGRNRVPAPAAGMTALLTCIARTIGDARRRLLTCFRLPGVRPDHSGYWPVSFGSVPTFVYKFVDSGETIEIQQSFDE